MTTFEHWDKVISVTAKDTSLEALVDFEDQNWNVYISERWKTLSNPMRIVLEKKYQAQNCTKYCVRETAKRWKRQLFGHWQL